jgi:hypothetical protein
MARLSRVLDGPMNQFQHFEALTDCGEQSRRRNQKEDLGFFQHEGRAMAGLSCPVQSSDLPQDYRHSS